MERWLGGLSVVCIVVLATLVSGGWVQVAGSPYAVAGYLFPAVGYACGAGLGYAVYRQQTMAPSSDPTPSRGFRIPLHTMRTLAMVAGVGLTTGVGAAAGGEVITLKWGAQALGGFPAFPLPLLGFGLGYGPFYVMAQIASRFPSDAPYAARHSGGVILSVAAVWVLTVVALALGAIGFGQAVAIALSGSAAIPCAWEVVRRLQAGEGFAMESHWGGLGGGLGGWRVSSLTTSTLLALVFGAVTVVAAIGWPATAPGPVTRAIDAPHAPPSAAPPGAAHRAPEG